MKTYQQTETALTRGFDPLGSWLEDWGGLLTIGIALLIISNLPWLLFSGANVEHKTLIAVLIQTSVGLGMIIIALRASQLLAERATRAAEAGYVSLIEQASEVITIIEANGKVLYESPSLERVYGYSIPELAGRSLIDLVHPDSRTEARDLVARLCARSGMCGRLELRFLHKNGQYVDVEAVITNLLDDPNIRGIVINSRNIAERKQADEALLGIQEQLRQSQKMEAVGKLAVSVTHDFNNRLAVIIGYSDMLLKRSSFGLTENAQRKVEQIKNAGHEAAGLITQIQTLSREQGLRPKPPEMNTVVDDADKTWESDPIGWQPPVHASPDLDAVSIG